MIAPYNWIGLIYNPCYKFFAKVLSLAKEHAKVLFFSE